MIRVACLCSLALLSLVGCDLEMEAKSPKPLPPQTAEPATVEKAKPEPPAKPASDPNGHARFDLPVPASFETCYLRILPIGERAVVQIASYQPAGSDASPSFFLQGETDSQNPESLDGASLPCQLFIQPKKDQDIWSNMGLPPVMVQISRTEAGFVANLNNAELRNATSRTTTRVSGMMECVSEF